MASTASGACWRSESLRTAPPTTAGYTVKGLLFGDVGQFVAQVIGAAVCFAWAFGASYVFFKLCDRVTKLRVSPEVEIAGLDLPEMGLAGYIPDDPLPVPPEYADLPGMPSPMPA